MKAAFVHDHRFPFKDGMYFSSPGFENTFIYRYQEIFDNIKIIARKDIIYNSDGLEPLTTDNVEYYTISNTKSLFSFSNLKKIKEELCECGYVVIRIPSILGLLAGHICTENNIPFILEVVGCPWDSLAFKGGLWSFYGRTYSTLMKRLINNSKYVVYVSEEFLEKRYPTKGRYTNISNVVLNNYGSCNIFNRGEKINKFNPKIRMVIGTCGSLDAEYKSQEDVIKIIPLLKKSGINVVYQLVGNGSPKRLLECAKCYNVLDNIMILGEMKHNDVFLWLDNLDFYIHPSKQEGLCRAIIEAMSRGCPIIASDAGGVYEQINSEYIYPKGEYIKIYKLLMDFTKEKMIQESLRNYKNASKYQSSILNMRRKNFFKEFIDQK